jgi:hypothetical protein
VATVLIVGACRAPFVARVTVACWRQPLAKAGVLKPVVLLHEVLCMTAIVCLTCIDSLMHLMLQLS